MDATFWYKKQELDIYIKWILNDFVHNYMYYLILNHVQNLYVERSKLEIYGQLFLCSVIFGYTFGIGYYPFRFEYSISSKSISVRVWFGYRFGYQVKWPFLLTLFLNYTINIVLSLYSIHYHIVISHYSLRNNTFKC